MSEVSVGVRELKAHLSEYVRKVKGGETVAITDRGKVVARMIPINSAATPREKLHALARAGILDWDGQDIPDDAPPASSKPGTSVAEVVIEQRG